MARNDPPRVLMDACALIAIIKQEEFSERLDGLLEMLDRGDAQLVESVQILGEVYKKSTVQDPDARLLEDEKLANIRARLMSRQVELLDVTGPIIRRATEFRGTYGLKLPDSVHLATAVLNRCDWFVSFDDKFPDLSGLRTFRMEHLVNSSVTLPWDAAVQGALFPLPESAALPSNVIPMRPTGSPDAEVAGS